MVCHRSEARSDSGPSPSKPSVSPVAGVPQAKSMVRHVEVTSSDSSRFAGSMRMVRLLWLGASKKTHGGGNGRSESVSLSRETNCIILLILGARDKSVEVCRPEDRGSTSDLDCSESRGELAAGFEDVSLD